MFLLREGSFVCSAAVGPSAGGRISSHPVENAFTGSVNFASGATIGGTSVRLVSKKVVAHGVLMIVGWGLLLPLGVVFARCKEWGQVWFQLHRAFQVRNCHLLHQLPLNKHTLSSTAASAPPIIILTLKSGLLHPCFLEACMI